VIGRENGDVYDAPFWQRLIMNFDLRKTGFVEKSQYVYFAEESHLKGRAGAAVKLQILE
jgi:hypothetical protein